MITKFWDEERETCFLAFFTPVFYICLVLFSLLCYLINVLHIFIKSSNPRKKPEDQNNSSSYLCGRFLRLFLPGGDGLLRTEDGLSCPLAGPRRHHLQWEELPDTLQDGPGRRQAGRRRLQAGRQVARHGGQRPTPQPAALREAAVLPTVRNSGHNNPKDDK